MVLKNRLKSSVMELDNTSTKSSVLIVDDNPRNLQVLGGFLKEKGLLVEFAIDGHSALEWFNKRRFDLILLDIMMPGMNGFEVCRKIKENPVTCDIPVIFITAVSDTDSIVKGFNIGAVDYITKPFIQDELLVRIKTQLEAVRSKQLILEYLSNIEEKNKNINSSIDYARYIQNAVIQTSETSSKYLPDYFIIDHPKDILSGDYYWINNIDGQVIFAVMDCTGHGVPGALMSILGTTFLNDIICHKKILQPDKILECLREKLIHSLGQKQNSVVVKDGMEGSVVNFDQSTSTLTFAGSLNPMVHIRNNEMTLLKADRFPIGFYDKEAKFSLNTIKINKDDMVYLYSDGYIDQFGGPDSKKIKSKGFRELLLTYHELPLMAQKTKLEEYLNLWRGNLEQTDDILVVGIRF
ncbi:MAG: hypothetical protein A2X03_10780 [Bacteroidetes bacterium GWA2_40_15]|nr:MAG: hypothetical protein A2X03_10780 [Bacteroidetes bacterium GWA2_40_15]